MYRLDSLCICYMHFLCVFVRIFCGVDVAHVFSFRSRERDVLGGFPCVAPSVKPALLRPWYGMVWLLAARLCVWVIVVA